MKTIFTLDRPKIKLISGFLSDRECDDLIAAARPRLTQTLTYTANATWVDPTIRNSMSAYASGGVFDHVGRKMDKMFPNYTARNTELTVLMYPVGGFFLPHSDGATDKRTIKRVATMMVYLNTTIRGGATRFPALGLEVRPMKGHALLFEYAEPDDILSSVHEGAVVEEGEKWAAVKWYYTR